MNLFYVCAGLSAAKLLHENGVGVLVLEASNRIGGRLHTVKVVYLVISILKYFTKECYFIFIALIHTS